MAILKFSKMIRENLREIFVGVLIILISASMIGAFNVMTSAIGWLRSIDRNTYQTSQTLDAMKQDVQENSSYRVRSETKLNEHEKRLDSHDVDISILKTKVK